MFSMILRALAVALLTALCFVSFIEIHEQGHGSCVLFATCHPVLVGLELNTDARPCQDWIVGEKAVLICALALTLWFGVKAWLNIGADMKLGVALLLLQVLFLFFMLILAVSCSVMITFTLNHICSSHQSRSWKNLACSELYFDNSVGEPVFFYNKMKMSEFTAWLSAVLIFTMLYSSLSSVNYQCIKRHLWPSLGKFVHLGHQEIKDGPKPKLSLVADYNPLQVLKLFTLPCQYTPLFGSCRVQAHIKSIQEKHDVEFTLLDEAGISTAIQSLNKTISDLFNAQTSGIRKIEDCLSDYLTPSSLRKFIWLWQNDKSGFSPYDPDLNGILEAVYDASPEGFTNCGDMNKHEVGNYTIDFVSMTQTNRQTGRKRMIKYEAVAIVWQYKNSQGKYVSHSHCHSETIERMYVNGNLVPLSIQGETFTFNFHSMVQIGTGGPISIHRKISSVIVPTASYELRLQVQGPLASRLDFAISDLKKKLTSFLCSKKHMISDSSEFHSPAASVASTVTPTLNRTVQTILLQKARHYFVSTLISASKIELLGTQEQVDKVMLLLQQLLLERLVPCSHPQSNHSLQAVQKPSHWSPQTDDFTLIRVNTRTSEVDRLLDLFFTTLPNAQIHRIDRIQNLWLWEKYGFAKHRMTRKNHGNIKERELFHGTGSTIPEKVFRSEHGFDFRCANQGYWGEGAYFAVNAGYSDHYAYRSAGKKQMILAKVLTGNACYLSPTDSTRKLKQPPVVPSSSRSSAGAVFHEERYDTVCGHSGQSDIYVVYDHDKAYPAYLITYQTA